MKVLIFVNTKTSAARDAACMAAAYLSAQNIALDTVASEDIVIPGDAGFGLAAVAAERARIAPPLRDDYDLAVVFGGDGTILRCACVLQGKNTPILGINYGHLGFLSNPETKGVVALISAALVGELQVEERVNLDIEVYGDLPDVQQKHYFAFNELALTRGKSGKIIGCGVDISGNRVFHVRGDGVVVATATGSTGYALSAGGPLVAPGFRGLVVVPIAPHTLSARALVTESNDVVEITVDKEEREEAMLFADGRTIVEDVGIERVIVQKGHVPTKLLRYEADAFYRSVAQVFYRQ